MAYKKDVQPWSKTFITEEKHSRLAKYQADVTFDMTVFFIAILICVLIAMEYL